MAVEFVKKSDGTVWTPNESVNILTTIGGGDDQIDNNFYLVVLCIDSATTVASAVTLAGQSCALKRRKQVSGSYPTLEVWYVDHPGGGGERLVFTLSNVDLAFAWAVLEFSGVDPTDPIGQVQDVTDTSNVPTATVPDVVESSLVVGSFGIFGSAIGGTPQSGDTERVESEGNNRNLNITSEPQPLESGSIQVGTTLSESRNWVAIGLELLEDGAPLVTGATILTGSGDLSPTGQVFEGGDPTVTLTGVGNLSPTGTAGQVNGTVTFTGAGDLSPLARLDDIYRDESQAESGGTASVDQSPTGP